MTASAADLPPARLAESTQDITDFGHRRTMRGLALPADSFPLTDARQRHPPRAPSQLCQLQIGRCGRRGARGGDDHQVRPRTGRIRPDASTHAPTPWGRLVDDWSTYGRGMPA